ncbi:MAG: phasin [Stappiaceae bacterium]
MADTKDGFEVPEQMREFADKSVDQAKKAFDDFIEATHKTVTSIEDTAANVQTGATDVNKQALSYAEENVTAAFELAQKMVRAKDFQEMMTLQNSYLQRQMENLGEQARELGDKMTKNSGNT